jgi:spore coat protein H
LSTASGIQFEYVKANLEFGAEKYFGAKTGALFKPVTRDLFKDLGTNWATYKQSYDTKTDLTVAQMQRVFDFARLVTTADDTEFATRVDEFLDMDEFARFMAVTVYLSALDSILSMGQNFLLYLDPKSNKFQFIPWDLDNSFGAFYMAGTQEERNHLSISQPWQGTNRFLARVFKVEAFQKIFRAWLAEFNRTLFQPERFTNQVNAVAAAIRLAVKEESEKSNESPEKPTRFDKLVAGESVEHAGPGGLGPNGIHGGNPRSFGTIEPIKSFVAVRAQSIADQLAGKSEGKIINGNSE